MKFNNTDDDDKESFYDSYTPEEPKKPKPPRYKPDDPRYWYAPASRWEHLIPSSRQRRRLWLTGSATALLLLLCMAGCHFLSPCADDAVQYGYVENVERRGTVFKTYEGTLIPYKSMHDTTRSYEGDFTFSAPSDLGAALRTFQNSGRPLRVEYRRYRHALPWKGENRTVLIRVDTVCPDSIMPYISNPSARPRQ